MKKIYLLLFLIVAPFCLSGCILVPFIESFRSAGVMQDDRENLLQEQIVYFNRARSWGKPYQTLKFVTEESRPSMRKLFSQGDKEKVIETSVDDMMFKEEAYKAEVYARIKYFKVPYYVVEERVEKQQWDFSTVDGWKLSALEINSDL